MFTGIIEEVGSVVRVVPTGPHRELVIRAVKVQEGTAPGMSVAVNGVCLTLVHAQGIEMTFDLLAETLERTNLRFLKAGDKVNLERALAAGGRIGGHFVLGHVDCVGTIRRRGVRRGNRVLGIAVPLEYISYLYPKASIAVEGVSLTVVASRGAEFSVHLIGQTLRETTLSGVTVSSRVNVEFDCLSKQQVHLMKHGRLFG